MFVVSEAVLVSSYLARIVYISNILSYSGLFENESYKGWSPRVSSCFSFGLNLCFVSISILRRADYFFIY